MSDYLAYQAKYRDTPRAADVELIRMISKRTPKNGRVLDVGCSTGNLLRHLYAARDDLHLNGIDVSADAVAVARAGGWVAEEADILTTKWGGSYDPYDALILNAVLYCLDDTQAATALLHCQSALKPGGHLFIWDLLHPWNQRLTITEESARYGTPTIHIRPYKLLHDMAADAGYSMCKILPQKQPRLQKPDDPDDLTSWTYPQSWRWGGISFRGGLAQPWCHAILLK